MYFKPHIDETGIHIPLYSDIVEYLVGKAKSIFGSDIYLEIDSQDYQYISSFAEIINDANELAVMLHNNRGPSTAIGVGLDGVVKLNGIQRKGQTHSLCAVILSGAPGTRIFAGVVEGSTGEKWDIGDVTIPQGGEIEVMATCRESGSVYADAGSITKIVTQTRGWWAVTNQANATPGQSVETDAALRSRQAISTMNPTRTVLQGIEGGVAAVLNVTRYRAYENDSNVPDANGLPGHSNSLVVEGGDNYEIAFIINQRKTPGSGTYGDVQIQIEASETTLTQPPPICFFRPRYVDVWVLVQIKTLSGFVSQNAEDIHKNISAYLNSIRIGESVTVSALYVPAMAATPNIAAPSYSIHRLLIGKTENGMGTEDLPICFNEVTRGIWDHIKVVAI